MAGRKPTPRTPLAAAGPGAVPVLDASPNGILGIDAQGVIVYANLRAQAVFGWTPAELIGMTVEQLIPDRLKTKHVSHRTGFFSNPTARPMGIGLDLAGRRRDGSEFPVEISLAPVETEQGRLAFATVVDITARKALESQLLQAQKMESVGRLAGGIAHDFNNMLFAIRGYADLLTEDLDDALERPLDLNEVRRSVAAIGVAAERATVLTAQLLSFSRQQVVQPTIVDVGEAVRTLEPMLERLIGENVRLVLATGSRTGRVRIDPGQLDQILVNLVVNARDAMPSGGTVTIETGSVIFDEPYAIEHLDVQPGSYVMLAVSDTGQGMDHEVRRHIFEPFFTTKEPGKGTGLGLATTYGIVRQSNGHIWLYSEPGQGTSFKIYLPLLGADVEAMPPVISTGPAVQAGKVLLVEDEPSVRDLTKRVLERAGYVVTAPADPRDALALVEPGGPPIDVLVTDMVMPGLSGRDLARRSMAARPETAVVLLSGYSAETSQIADLIELGATFASKPLSTRELLRVVDEALLSRAAVPRGWPEAERRRTPS